MPSLSFTMADGLRTDVSDGVYQTNQSQPVRRARLQKKSVRKLNQAESPPLATATAEMDKAPGFRAHRRHKSASAMFFGSSITSPRVQIIPSMFSAGIPRPPQLPIEYQNAKLLSEQPAAVPEAPEAAQEIRRSSAEVSAAAAASTEQLANLSAGSDISHRVRTFQRTSGPFGPKPRDPPKSIADVHSQRPSTADGPKRAAVRMASAPTLIQRRKPVTRFDFDSVVEEELRPKSDRRKSAASSCYSAVSASTATSAVWGLDHVRAALSPTEMDKDLPPNPFAGTREHRSETVYPLSEAALPEPLPCLNDADTARPQSRESTKDWSRPRLSAIPSEPDSRVSKAESILHDNGPSSSAVLGIRSHPRSSNANLAHACQQLEEQLEVVSERIHAKEQASQMVLKVTTHQNDRRPRRPRQRPTSPTFSSSSRSSPHSDSGASSIGTPMTECSPNSFEPTFSKPTLSRSGSLLNLLEGPGRQPASLKMHEEDDSTIDASSATQVIYHILAALPDLSSLFSAALISRGFYQVFKAYELRLIKHVVRKMSSALWEICELSQAKGNFLTMDDHTLHAINTPTSLYLRDYDHAMYTVVALKVMIPDRCRGILRDDELAHFLCEADQERASRIDAAIWRIWTFCATFGCHTGRQHDLGAQKSWLGGGPYSSRKSTGKKSGYGLSRKEIKDILEVWNALYALLRSLDLQVSDAKHVGLLDRDTPDQYAQPLLDEWLHYLLSLGPRAVLDLASTWPSSSFAAMQKAKFKGWTNWTAPDDGTTMATFLHEAATRLHVEAVLSETRDMSFSLPARAANRTISRGTNDATPTKQHKKSKSESAPPLRADLQSPSRTRSATTSRSNEQREYPRLPLRSKASSTSSSSTLSNESKVLQWKQTIRAMHSDEKRLSGPKPLPELPLHSKQSSVSSIERPPTLPQVSGNQAADEMIKWSLLAAGLESPRLGNFGRANSSRRSPVEPHSPSREEWSHQAPRMNSLTSSSGGADRSARLSPLVEFGEGQFALPYNAAQDVKPAPRFPGLAGKPSLPQQLPPQQQSKSAPSPKSAEGGSSHKSHHPRTSEDTVSETISRGFSTRRRRPTSSIFDVKLRQTKKERRKSSAQFLAHMSEACEMHGLC